jgi:hypothetical protein
MLDTILSAIDALTGAQDAPTQRKKAAKRRHPRHGQMHTITVQKPFCAPCRDRLLTALYLADAPHQTGGDKRYGVPIYNLRERPVVVSIKDAAKLWRIEMHDQENIKYGFGAIMFLPTAYQASFEVPIQQAKWAQYLCERIGLAVVSGGLDANARRNADRYNFKPPPRWDGRNVQIETTCSEGVELWQALQRGEKPPNISDELMQELTKPRR